MGLSFWVRRGHITYVRPTVRSPQSSGIVEQSHRVIGDMGRVQLATQHQHDDPIRAMLSATAYGIRATVHARDTADGTTHSRSRGSSTALFILVLTVLRSTTGPT